MGRVVLGVIGGAVGFVVSGGNPYATAMGFSIGFGVGAATEKQPGQDGPRLDDLRFTGSQYGQPIPWVRGSPRISGQIIWASAKRETSTTTEQGKGGGPESTTFSYSIDVLVLLADHESGAVSRIWSNGKLVWTGRAEATDESIASSDETDLWARLQFYGGTVAQLPDPSYEAVVGVGNAPAYRGRTTLMIEGLKLGSSGQLPNLTFEVFELPLEDPIIFNAPLTTNAVDLVSPAAAATVTGNVTYSAAGALILWRGSPFFANSNILYSAAAKIDAAATTGRFAISVTIAVDPAWTGPTTDFHDVFGLAAGATNNVSFAFWAPGAGELRVYAAVVQNSVSILSPLTTNAAFQAVLPSARYEIEWTATNTCRWKIDDVVFHETSFPRISGALFVSNGIVKDAGLVPLPATFSQLKIYSKRAPILRDTLLRPVVEALCLRAGMPAGSYDASALASITRPVRSLAISGGNVRGTLEQLSTAFYFQAFLRDKLYFVPRGATPAATIPWADLASGSDDPASDSLPLRIGNDLELPPQVAVTYNNVNDDAQAGTEYSDRMTGGQAAVQKLNLGIGMLPAEAKEVADAVVLDTAASLVSAAISLPMTYARLDPGDVVEVVDRDSRVYRMRLIRKRDERGVLGFEVAGDDASALVSSGLTDATQAQASAVNKPSDTAFIALDVPLLRDADDGPGYYVAAKGATAAWPGGQVFSSINNTTFTTAASVSDPAVFGTCTTTLGNVAGVGFDEVNALTVSVGNGLLSSSTRDAILIDKAVNAMAVGDEVIRFRTATLSSPGVYVLTGLLRGQAGTEWAVAAHVASERCALLTAKGLRRVPQQASENGQLRFLRAGTAGATMGPTSTNFTNTNRALRPLAPVDVRAAPSISGDLVISWKRRTRLSSPLFGAVPIGEASLAFEVEVVVASVVVRTIFVAALSATYTRAQQQTNGVSIDTAVTLRVYQMSGVVGRGYVATLTGVTGASPALLPQITTVTYGGTFQTGSIARVSLGGGTFSYVTQASDTNLAGVATAVAALIDASPDYVSSSAGAVVTVTGVASTSFPAFAGFTPGDNFGRGAIVQTAAAQSAGAAYFAHHFLTNVVTGVSDPVPSGTTLRIDYYRPIGTFVGSISYTTPAAEAALTALGGLQAAMTANATLRALGYGFGITPLSGSSVGYSVGPFGSAGVYTEGGANNQFSITSSVVNPGSAAIPADRPQIITLEVVGAPVVGWVYIVTLDDVPFSYTAVVADTTTSIAAGLAAIIDPSANFIATSLTNVLTITRATANVAFANGYDIISSTITATVATTQAAS